MDVLWPALAIAAIVVFVFYILAQHWQRILRQQAWTIRRLFERVQDLEEMADPEFRRRIGEAAPVPLERVFTLSFRLADRFWRDALHASEEDRQFVRECGSFVGSVKLERWRSHTVATITEVLPDQKTAGWQTRSLDFYSDPAKTSATLTLWELALSRPGLSAERQPSLELVLRRNSMELCGHLAHRENGPSENDDRASSGRDDVVFFACLSIRRNWRSSKAMIRRAMETTEREASAQRKGPETTIPGRHFIPIATKSLGSNGSCACGI
jgi:hypothetical protein